MIEIVIIENNREIHMKNNADYPQRATLVLKTKIVKK